jgi:hypothetical protein
MRPAAILAVPLGFAFLFIGIGQVSTLQDISKPITAGAVNELWGTTTFIMLLIAMVGALTAVCSAMIWALRR